MNTDLILINGDIVDSKEAVIDYNDRGHQFGDGVFEIVPVYNGKVFGMLPHMENLYGKPLYFGNALKNTGSLHGGGTGGVSRSVN